MTIDAAAGLCRYIHLDATECDAIDRVASRYPMRITAYYASLMSPDDRNCPLRRQFVPSPEELDDGFGDGDPLGEEANMPVPGIIRVYPDRIAVIATNRCAAYCRHCLRKRLPRDASGDLTGERLERVLAYVRSDSSIRDVLITGGDPLEFRDDELAVLLNGFRSISHVDIIRIGTRSPCTNPGRITPALVSLLARYHPLWISTQFNHPRELTGSAVEALELLVNSGIPVNNQSVLMRGVNDSAEVMRELVLGLVQHRVRPYYMYQAQTLRGTGHFVVPIERGLDMIKQLRGRTTGFAIPQYVLDTPYGKVPLNPGYIVGREGDSFVVRTWSGKTWREYNPRTP